MHRILLVLIVALALQGISADVKLKRKCAARRAQRMGHYDESDDHLGQQCRDLVGDRSNCQRFIRCFHNLRVIFTCAAGTAYSPELKTCVAKESVKDCNSTKNRIGEFRMILIIHPIDNNVRSCRSDDQCQRNSIGWWIPNHHCWSQCLGRAHTKGCLGQGWCC